MIDIFLQLLHHSWLPAGSFLAGVLNSIAGGGSFLSLPALFDSAAALGIGAITVQATNTVALWPGQLTGLIAFRKELREYGWELLPLGIASGIGGWFGGFLLLRTGNVHVPPAAAVAAVICGSDVCAQFSSGRWLQTRSGGKRHNTLLIVGMVIVSVYVGYFGAGGGFLVMALFGICGVHDIHEMNALKVLTAAVSIGIPAVSFIIAGRVHWSFCLEMAFLAALGGYIGAHYSRLDQPGHHAQNSRCHWLYDRRVLLCPELRLPPGTLTARLRS